MFRVPLVWAAIVAVSVGALSIGMPADHALRTFAIGMIGVSVPLGLVVIFKRAQRQPRRDDWAHLGCDPVAPPLPPPAPRVRIETPQPLQLEAPRKELTTWHNGTE